VQDSQDATQNVTNIAVFIDSSSYKCLNKKYTEGGAIHCYDKIEFDLQVTVHHEKFLE